mgnify:CR=1 FL=1
MASNHKSVAFYEAGSWYHRIKILKADGTTGYSKKGGFASAEEAEKSYRYCEEEFARAYRNYHAATSTDFELREYLIYWLEEIYTAKSPDTSDFLMLSPGKPATLPY